MLCTLAISGMNGESSTLTFRVTFISLFVFVESEIVARVPIRNV